MVSFFFFFFSPNKTSFRSGYNIECSVLLIACKCCNSNGASNYFLQSDVHPKCDGKNSGIFEWDMNMC